MAVRIQPIIAARNSSRRPRPDTQQRIGQFEGGELDRAGLIDPGLIDGDADARLHLHGAGADDPGRAREARAIGDQGRRASAPTPTRRHRGRHEHGRGDAHRCRGHGVVGVAAGTKGSSTSCGSPCSE